MIDAVTRRWRVAPDNGLLVATAGLAAVLVTAVPLLLLGSALHVVTVAGALVAAGAVLFSPRRTLVALVVVTAVLPAHLVDAARLPLGLRPWEILLLAGGLFAVIDLVWFEGLRRTSADRLLVAFLAVALLSGLLGMAIGNEAVLRNLRYPLYYAVFFVVLQSAGARDGPRLFAPLLALAGAVVSAEYVLEFLGAIDLSTGERFVRVSRRQGVVLPISMLMLANQLVHDPRRWGRPLLIGLFLFTGLGLAITMGRGMWVAFGLGLVVTVWLWHHGHPAHRRRAWKSIGLTVGLLVALSASVLAFQRLTGAAISAHAVERSRTFVDYSRDIQVLSRLLTYSGAWEQIQRHPVLGSGQGATVTSYSFNPETSRFETWTAWTIDSLYLTLWLKMGLAGLILFPWLCLHVGRRALRVCRQHPDAGTRAFAGGAAATLAAMALLGVSDGSMMNGRFAALFAILLGLVMIIESDTDATAPEAAA